MDQMSPRPDQAVAAELLEAMQDLKSTVVQEAEPEIARFGAQAVAADPALANLAYYIALRRHDLRPLQRRLMPLGLSSLGRLESRVMPTLDAVISALSALSGHQGATLPPEEREFFRGEQSLAEASDALFGRPNPGRRTRIMVTLPSEAAENPGFVLELARSGMDVARVNCAHDDAAAWRAMAANVRSAGREIRRDIAVLMDIAGPKIRTAAVETPDKKAKLQAGDRVRLVASGKPRCCADVRFSAGVSLPEMVTRLSVGDRVRYDDGKLDAVVESVGEGEAVILVRQTKASGVKLKPEKGINLPDTALGLSPLTAKDQNDLATVTEIADIIGYSFVSHPDDIDLLDAALAEQGGEKRRLGLIAKIEQPEALRNLPALIARARQRGPFGVMIARGDLAAEIGFERLAEMQEEILWICEAASVPAIWATQVLEVLVKEGVPSRGEMTDAAMAGRAECVMLNKGPAVTRAVMLLDGLLARMDQHVLKKTPTLRALKSW